MECPKLGISVLTSSGVMLPHCPPAGAPQQLRAHCHSFPQHGLTPALPFPVPHVPTPPHQHAPPHLSYIILTEILFALSVGLPIGMLAIVDQHLTSKPFTYTGARARRKQPVAGRQVAMSHCLTGKGGETMPLHRRPPAFAGYSHARAGARAMQATCASAKGSERACGAAEALRRAALALAAAPASASSRCTRGPLSWSPAGTELPAAYQNRTFNIEL